jgi:NAD(P)-dependent dehydrogenase (short-subunit alcohol dehydrogenase family)
MTYQKDFNGKNVIMTGATGGIGSAVAKKLLKNGKISQ